MKHKWRYSDSSLYDAVCTACNCTDAVSDIRSSLPCAGSEKQGIINAKKWVVMDRKLAYERAVSELEQLEKENEITDC